jgi:hypothetical protein
MAHDQHQQGLLEQLKRGQLVFFMGADLSQELTGLPSRADLARDLARRKGLDESLSLAEVAQRVSQAGNRWEFTGFIRNALDTVGRSPQPFHRRIVELVETHRIEILITTAYDNLLELAFQEAGVGINRVVRGSDVAFIHPDRPTLIKFYGDAQQPETLIVTDRDHSDLLRDRDREPLVDEVRRAFRRNTVFFLGYNLADPDFRFLFDQIAESRFARTAYAVWPGLPEADARMWRDRGIVILGTDPLRILDAWAGGVPSDQAKLFPSVAVLTKETLYLDTTAALFAQWLAECTQLAPYRRFPTEKGRLVLQSIKPPLSIQAPTALAMDTIHVVPKEDEDTELACPVRAAITFRVIPLSSERVEVQAECNQPVVADYFRELLAEIKQRWPTKEAVSETPSALPHHLEPTTVPHTQQLSAGGKDMDFERGLDAFKRLAEGTAWYQDFTVHEASLRENLRDERRYGPSEQTRRDRTRIVDRLNTLAIEHLGISFNDLCMEQQPPSSTQLPPDDHEIIERLRRIEDKMDHGRAEDYQTAAQILDAIAQNQVEQAEATQMVAELCTWAQTVQHAGLPLNPELRAALDALAEHTGGVYQYLELALPLIPGILSYNVELGTQHQVDLKVIWERIKTRLGKGFKGDGASTGPEPLYGIGNRWAVLVGVNEYEDKANYGQLHVCAKDVHAIREQLIDGGFDPVRIRLLTDETGELPTKANILVALKAAAVATELDDLLLFYYSGHGDEEGGESYLVARDGRRLVLSDTAVPLSRVREIVEGAPARAKVIVLDACHSGADIGGKGPKPMSEEFIRRVFEQAEGLAILASCKQGELSYEWREYERSAFTHFLLEALEGQADRDEKGFITVQDANRHVTNGVKLWASQRYVSQTPTMQYTVAGDIILVRYP